MKREECLSHRRAATFAELRETNLKTSPACAIRELLREFRERPGEFTGRLFFGEWYAWASRCRLAPMVRTAKRLMRHLKRLVTWFEHPITNASAEGPNSVSHGLKTAARGFRSFANYRIRILFGCGRVDMEPVTRLSTSH